MNKLISNTFEYEWPSKKVKSRVRAPGTGRYHGLLNWNFGRNTDCEQSFVCPEVHPNLDPNDFLAVKVEMHLCIHFVN